MTRQTPQRQRHALWAWILLLAFLPQMIVKTFHYHEDAAPCVASSQKAEACTCATDLMLYGSHLLSHIKATALAHHSAAERHWHPIAPQQAHPDGDSTHQCSICHQVLSPCWVQPISTFSYFIPEKVRLFAAVQASPTLRAYTAQSLRGPPHAAI